MSEPSDPQIATGRCLRGAVRYAVHGCLPPVGICDCSLCRRASGGASNAVLNVRAGRFVWLAGADQVREFRAPSGWGSFFRATCGCPAPRLFKDDRYLVPAGSLDVDPGPRVAGHIFVGSKASWDVIGDKAPRFDEFPEDS